MGQSPEHNYFNGIIDEITVWESALTQQEILNNMNIDGLLVGGASLNFNSFFSMLKHK